MKDIFNYFKLKFISITLFSFLVTLLTILYEHYGWLVYNKQGVSISLFSTKEEGSVICAGLPFPYIFDFSGTPWIDFLNYSEFYWNIFLLDTLFWIIIFTWFFNKKSQI